MTVDRAAIARRLRARMQGSRAIPRVLVAGTKVVVVFSLLALSFSTTYAASPGAFSDSDLLGILTLGGAVNGGALLAGAGRFAPWAANALLALLAVVGIACSYAVHTDLILSSPVLLWALLGSAGFALFVAFGAIDRSPSVGMALAALGSLAVGMYTAELWFKADGTQAVVVTGDRSNLRDVTFERRPNIYFVSFDGMAPRTLLRKYMGLESTPFHDLFEVRFRRFENFFVNALYTTHSLQLPFALAYVYVPGHPSRSFQYSDEEQLRGFRAHYRRGSADAAGLLAKLLAHLDEHDPDAILLVFGDHGALLSYNVAFADAPEFVVQDHFGALGGVYPPDACAEWFDEAQEKRGYLTLLDAVHTVIRCLSGGESALRAPPEDYYLGGWNGVVPDGHRRTYKEFLYE